MGNEARTVSSTRPRDGSISTVHDAQLIEKTRNVPAKLGVRFGFRHVVVGKPKGANVTLRKIVTFPPGGLHNPASKEAVSRWEGNIARILSGKPNYTDYAFDDPWELVPGRWTIELWDGDRKLASQSFNVIKQ